MVYNAKVYRKQGGDELVVDAGGAITVKAGGALTFEGADPIDDLNLTVSDPPTQAEVQAISDKVDEILAAMRAAGTIPSA